MKLKTISRVNTKLDNNEIIVYIEGNNPSQLERFKDYINLYNQKTNSCYGWKNMFN